MRITLYFLLISTAILPIRMHSQEVIANEKAGLHQFHLEGGALIGGYITLNNFTYNSGYTLQGTYYHQLHEQFYLGGGLGFDKVKNFTNLPFYVSLRGSFRKSSVPTFLFAHFGYALGWSNDLFPDTQYGYRGGFVFNPGVGITAWDNDTIGLIFSFGYKLQLTKVDLLNSGIAESVTSGLDHHFVTIRTGIAF